MSLYKWFICTSRQLFPLYKCVWAGLFPTALSFTLRFGVSSLKSCDPILLQSQCHEMELWQTTTLNTHRTKMKKGTKPERTSEEVF